MPSNITSLPSEPTTTESNSALPAAPAFSILKLPVELLVMIDSKLSRVPHTALAMTCKEISAALKAGSKLPRPPFGHRRRTVHSVNMPMTVVLAALLRCSSTCTYLHREYECTECEQRHDLCSFHSHRCSHCVADDPAACQRECPDPAEDFLWVPVPYRQDGSYIAVMSFSQVVGLGDEGWQVVCPRCRGAMAALSHRPATAERGGQRGLRGSSAWRVVFLLGR